MPKARQTNRGACRQERVGEKFIVSYRVAACGRGRNGQHGLHGGVPRWGGIGGWYARRNGLEARAVEVAGIHTVLSFRSSVKRTGFSGWPAISKESRNGRNWRDRRSRPIFICRPARSRDLRQLSQLLETYFNKQPNQSIVNFDYLRESLSHCSARRGVGFAKLIRAAGGRV